jgi:hypothetical protein
MPKNSSARTSGSEEVVNHFGAVRLRVTGTGNLIPIFYSLDNVTSTLLASIPLQSSSAVEPNRLGNCTQQRARLRLTTIAQGEYFSISRIVIFIKPVAKSLPETN